MSHRIGRPKPSASRRTIRRWLDPTNRQIYDHVDRKWIPSTNPDCTRGRNPERFSRRKA